MSLLAAPLDQAQIAAICKQYPSYVGALPAEAKFWTKAELEVFLSSSGKTRPKETAQKSSVTCPLLTRARVKLAEAKISESTAEYCSFCRHLLENKDVASLPGIAACTAVAKAKAAPEVLKAPVLVDKPREWAARLWNLEFWKRECGDQSGTCRARWPAFEDDMQGADTFAVEATIAEFVDYVRTMHRVDRKCLEENAVAYPRVGLEGWSPFHTAMPELLAECWKSLGPPGLQDSTAKWLQPFVHAFNQDPLQALAQYYQVSMGATGTVTRLHVESSNAHVWFNQIEGRRLFFLFPPQEAKNLYAIASRESSVDIFFPSAKRHPSFAEAKAQVATLYLGQTLIVPAGWWWYSVVLEPSVTLVHHFYNRENKVYFVEGLQERFNISRAPGVSAKLLAQNVEQTYEIIHQKVIADEDSDIDV